MNRFDRSSSIELRWSIYVLLIMVSTGAMLGRIMSVTNGNPWEPYPFLSANDRSRWSTIRSLIDYQTYAIDEVIFEYDDNGNLRYDKNGRPERSPYHSIDMVRHPDRDGIMRSYSSKPTLLPTMLAGVYWVCQQVSGVTLAERPFYIARMVLVVANVLPLVLMFFVMAALIDQNGTTDWGRIFVVACVTFATFLTTFSITLNNHIPAAVSAAIALYCLMQVWYQDDPRWRWHIIGGLAAAFTAANELPALSMFCLFSAAMIWKSPLKGLLAYVPAAALVVAAFFGTNYWAHDSWRPPYAHRGEGEKIGTLKITKAETLNARQIPAALKKLLADQPQKVDLTTNAAIEVEEKDIRWTLTDREEAVRFALLTGKDGIAVHEWDDWYVFQGAYWRSGKETKIDQGEPSVPWYIFNATFGHHGIFSLTPIWVAAFYGMALLIFHPASERRLLGFAVALLSVVVIGFYLARPQVDRNYGGFTCGMRWVFWLAPMWLLTMQAVADRWSKSRIGRFALVTMLLISVFSASYALSNPWTHPWMYDYWAYLEWIET